MNTRTSAIIGGIGRTLITLGCLTLAFAGFQLWGTGIAENRAQNGLEDDFQTNRLAYARFAEERGLSIGEVGGSGEPKTIVLARPGEEGDGPGGEPQIGELETDEPRSSTDGTPVEAVPDELRPRPGEALGVIRIPKIKVNKVVIAGTLRDDLRQGPGHYANTSLPGQAGNAAIAGHRTTYGAPFGDIDQLDPGDQIITETFQGTFYYEVLPQTTSDGNVSGHAIVTPYDVQVLDDYGDNRLTLTACHPKYSARQRIVVQAKLIDAPAATVELLAASDARAEKLQENLTEDQLAYEATGVDPETGEVNPEVTAGDELDCATCVELDEGNTVGSSPDALDESLGWHMEELTPFLIFSLLTGLAALAALIVSRRFRRWPSFIAASPVVLTLLFFSFTHLDQMLPAF